MDYGNYSSQRENFLKKLKTEKLKKNIKKSNTMLNLSVNNGGTIENSESSEISEFRSSEISVSSETSVSSVSSEVPRVPRFLSSEISEFRDFCKFRDF